MKKQYFFGIPLIFFAMISFGQNCPVQKSVSDDSICNGQTATVVLTDAEAGVTYELLSGAIAISSQTATSNGDLSFIINPGPTTNTSYTVYNVNAGCYYTDLGIVTVDPIPDAVATNPNQQICSDTGMATMIFSGAVAGTTFNWTRDNDTNVTGIGSNGSGNISGTLTNLTAIPQTVTFTITPTANGCSGNPIYTTVLVNPIPDVFASISSQTICSGNSISNIVLTGSVSGTTFNWTRDNDTNVTGIGSNGSGNISGTLTNLTAIPQTVTFTITPTANGCSGNPIYTTVLVNPITDVFASINSQTICSGNSISNIVLTGNVTGTTFNWIRNNGVIVTGIADSGSGDISGTLTNTTTTARTVIFTITPTANSCNGSPITVTVTVNPTPVASASAPTQTRCSGIALGSFGITSNVVGTTYTWVRDNTTDVTGIADNGTGNITGILTNTTATPQTVNFTVIPTANGCAGDPIIVSALINPRPVATATPQTQNICTGSSIADILLSSNVLGTTYTWTRNNTANVTGINNSGAGDIIGSLTNITSSTQTVTFTITPTYSSCNGSNITATVVVYPIPVASSSAPNQTRCSGVALISFGITSNVTGTTYSWVRDNTIDVTGIADNGTGNITGVLTNTTATPQTVNFTVTPTANGCVGNPIVVSALINPRPVAIATPQTQNICSGSSIADILLSSNVSGTTFTWVRNNTINVTGINNSGSGDIIGSLTNITTSTQTVTFTITPSYSGCNGSNITATVLVYPTPTASTTIGSQTICSGNPITIIPFTGITGTTYNWTRNNTVNVTGIATNGSGNIGGFLTNTTAIQQTVQFTITPTLNGCNGTPIVAEVIVEATSLGGAVTITQPNVSPIVNLLTECHVANGTLYLSGHRGNVVRWEFSTNAGVSWTTINNTTDIYNYTNITQTTVFRAVVQNTSVCALAFSASSMINVIPNIKPNPVSASPPTICNGGSSVLTAQSGYATSGSVASGGAFSNSNPTGWAVGGCGNCLNAGSSNTNPNPWQLSATNGGTYSGINYTADGKFAIVNGAFSPGSTSYLYTPIFNTFGLTTANLTFADAYNLQAGATILIQISVNSGAYTTLWSTTGPSTRTPYTDFHTNTRSIDLSAYLGQPNLRIRFGYIGNTGSSWAVDNIAIPDVPLNLSTQWVDATDGTVISNNSTITVTPSTTTTYAVTSFLNGCNSFGTDGTAYVTVTVNPRPTAIISLDQYVCYGNSATFTVHFTGNGPYRFTLFNGTTSTVYNNITPNASGDYTFSIPNMTITRTYTITALNDSRCTAILDDYDDSSVTVTVLDGTPGVWTGLISTDWFDCRNWQRGLPSATIDALIPSGMPRMPVIDPTSPYAAAYSFIAVARDITINLGASVTMTANSDLHIKRDWKNGGTFIPGTGTVTFNSTVNGMIQYMNAAPENNFFENYYNLTLNCTNGAIGVNTVNFFRLTVANNLILTSGDLRLTGEAQLVQNGNSANPLGGTGNLLRDQQGTKSSFHYNYWSSPVSPNNTTYTVGGVLKDGTNAATNPFNPGTISFGDGFYYADGPLTSPIKIANRWIYKYTAVSTSYFSWQLIGSNGSVNVGEGYIMKGVTGTAPNTDYQNYVFKGKPNSGDVNLNVALNQLYLIGNPYPSALDANTFIRDNIMDGGSAASNVFTGALYFWDHFGGYSHYLNQYVGGYATYTLMGATIAVSNDPMINNNNSNGIKTPRQYIPVGQGFFIRTDMAGATSNMTNPITGGPIIFRNTQRTFRTESPANSVFFRNQNLEEEAEIDTRQKIRLSFESPSGIKRHLLVGADAQASDGYDIGYDAPMIDVNNEDMYWNFPNGKLVIQALQHFNPDQIIPLGIKTASNGISKVKIEALENIPSNMQIYLFDNETGLYHDLRGANFEATLPIGELNGRFSIRFNNTTLSNEDSELLNGLLVFVNPDNILTIKNSRSDLIVQTVELFNILGQSVKKWDVKNEPQSNITLPVQHVRSGAYIVNLKTSEGVISKKVIIK
ncbi:PKD-like domain-containing protein [Flavobacterium enshiense]|uniref:PKD-like domain-containing protein n=1 Tax=Flavobacterium enshiense TaxID=1341165 RepID=UPI00345C70BC